MVGNIPEGGRERGTPKAKTTMLSTEEKSHAGGMASEAKRGCRNYRPNPHRRQRKHALSCGHWAQAAPLAKPEPLLFGASGEPAGRQLSAVQHRSVICSGNNGSSILDLADSEFGRLSKGLGAEPGSRTEVCERCNCCGPHSAQCLGCVHPASFFSRRFLNRRSGRSYHLAPVILHVVFVMRR